MTPGLQWKFCKQSPTRWPIQTYCINKFWNIPVIFFNLSVDDCISIRPCGMLLCHNRTQSWSAAETSGWIVAGCIQDAEAVAFTQTYWKQRNNKLKPQQGRLATWVSLWQESRSREKCLEKWPIFFSLRLENWIFISLSFLDFQEFENQISLSLLEEKILLLFLSFNILIEKCLFLLSIYESLPIISLSLL